MKYLHLLFLFGMCANLSGAQILSADEIEKSISSRDGTSLKAIHGDLNIYLKSNDESVREFAVEASRLDGIVDSDIQLFKEHFSQEKAPRIRISIIKAAGDVMLNSEDASNIIINAINPPYDSEDIVAAQICIQHPQQKMESKLLRMFSESGMLAKGPPLQALLALPKLPAEISSVLPKIKSEAEAYKDSQLKSLPKSPSGLSGNELNNLPINHILKLISTAEQKISNRSLNNKGNSVDSSEKLPNSEPVIESSPEVASTQANNQNIDYKSQKSTQRVKAPILVLLIGCVAALIALITYWTKRR